MRIIVFQFKVCSLEYFLDEMQEYEINIIIDNLKYMDRNLWEMVRFISYSNIQKDTKKHLSPTDILKFAWDNELTNTEISNEDIKRLSEKSRQIYDRFIKQNGQ